MSNGLINASIQANATKEAARQSAAAHIRYSEALRKHREEQLAKCILDFANFDESSLFRKSDKDLAAFQAEYPPEAPQYALALHEWNRRLVARQVKATRFAAIIGLVGIVIGVLLGWWLAAYPAPPIGVLQTELAGPSNNTSEGIRQPAAGLPKPSM